MMPRRAAKIDSNQSEIVNYLRACGFSVTITSMVGAGFPDIVAGKHGVNYHIEIKDGKGKLTPAQIKYHDEWRGQIMVVRCIEDLESIVQS
jgi:Holliday junction resolvase